MRPVSGGTAVGSLRSSCQAGVFGNVEEPFEIRSMYLALSLSSIIK